MIDEVTHLAAFVSSNLKKVDNNMLSSTSGGPANRINVHNFVSPPALPAPPSVQPVVGRVEPISHPQPIQIPQPQPTSVPVNQVDLIVKHLDRIATELSKINKKMTSIQKHLNDKPLSRSESISTAQAD